MRFQQLDPTVSVAGQILPEEMADVAAAGFRSVVCNRPDGEAPDQPAYAEIEAAAAAHGLSAAYVPIVPGQAGLAEVDAFGKLLDDLPKPILAFCRSGNRSAQLWSAAKARKP